MLSGINPLMMAGGGAAGLKPQDVFAATLYTGNGTAQTITTGIDMAGLGGLAWLKDRVSASFGDHILTDTVRGSTSSLFSNLTSAEAITSNRVTSFNSNGYSLGVSGGVNGSGVNYVGWSFRLAAKFFDVVTYTGNSTAGRTIAHSLGVGPGIIIVKRLDSGTNWTVYHRSQSGQYLYLNATAAAAADPGIFFGNDSAPIAPTTAVFTVGSHSNVNSSSGTYVAYLFAHDADPSGVVQCGTFTTDGSGNGSFATGWANGAQFAMLKCSTTTGDWEMFDASRTPSFSGNDARLRSNLASAEDSVARVSQSAGTLSFTGLSASQTYVGLFIREPI